jgi:metal-responsive CopG/Arc/MetJ family transcriptional regulator
MKNVHISLDEETLHRVDRAAKPLGLSRSEVVRQALRQWLRQRAVEGFEQGWITALQEQPDDPDLADVWLGTQRWSRS